MNNLTYSIFHMRILKNYYTYTSKYCKILIPVLWQQYKYYLEKKLVFLKTLWGESNF